MDPLILLKFCENENANLISNIGLLLTNAELNIMNLDNNVIKSLNTKCKSRAPVNNFFELTVPTYSDEEFQKHFHMSRMTMKKLTEYLESKYFHHANEIVPLNKKIAITVWILGNEGSYREVANLFGIHKSTVSYVFHEICNLLSKHRNDWIKWPNREQQVYTSLSTCFPNAVGFIDRCFIQVKGPKHNPTDFYKKKTRSIILQGVCDQNLKFIDIYIGQTGRARNAHIFRSSSLSENIEELIEPDCHLLGDSAYPLQLRLMTPYKDNRELTDLQKRYNEIHAAARVKIEIAFRRLKGKFERLKYLELYNIQEAPNIICAACVLHNFILEYETSEVQEEYATLIDLPQTTGTEKRDAICAMLDNL